MWKLIIIMIIIINNEIIICVWKCNNNINV